MKILFNEMNDTVLEHFQGGEGRFVPKMFNDGTNKIMRGRLEPGCSVGMHTHTGTSEQIVVESVTTDIIDAGTAFAPIVRTKQCSIYY